MAKLVYDGPDGTNEREIDAGAIADSGRGGDIRVNLEEDWYLHTPYTGLYWIRTSEDEGKMHYSCV
ncbi:hypothetical protein [Haladaptatus sp. T7]|uniref:hypothetical protein n=1 Tax=Haladaptatus sp. T7 TaxID=2029368 RepID=UPI0021A25151|nr:hypothetical protein [Haladaptatus sp. T7]GKZ14592.1 hypothetical protein HAL_24730 [Haladaptatus sp. T7]